MKTMLSVLAPGFLLSLSGLGGAEPRAKSSLLNSDPDVVYSEEFTEKEIEFLVARPATIFATKKGGRKLGVLKADSKVTFIGMTEKAYKVRGTATHGKVLGWVSPRFLASKDKDFVANLRKVYARQKLIRELVANHEVAIGMSTEEVSASLGKPTKTKVRQTVKGRTGVWEFIEYEDQDHYQAVRDPVTGRVFRQYSHTTKEEIGKIVVEFENEVVSAIEESENNEGGKVRIVTPPLVFAW